MPIRLLGGKHVFGYKDDPLGVQDHEARGFVQKSGSWVLDTLPDVLRNADKNALQKTKAVELALAQGSRFTPSSLTGGPSRDSFTETHDRRAHQTLSDPD